MLERKVSATVLVLTASVLLAIWPLPNTMALRHLMLLCGFVASCFILFKNSPRLVRLNAWPVFVLFSFFLWLVFHLFALSGNFEEQWQELTGDWLRTFMAANMGLALGLVLSDPTNHPSPRLQRLQEPFLILGLAGTITIFCVRYAYEVAQTGQWIHNNFFMTPYLGKTPLVIFGGLFLPILFIKINSALQQAESSHWYLYGFIGLASTLLTFYFANTKNGFAIFGMLASLFFLQVLFGNSKTKRKVRQTGGYALLLLCLLGFAYSVNKHLVSNPAWSNLIADYKVGIQIDQHNKWKNVEDSSMAWPLNGNGVTVDGSTYARTAWGRAGIDLIKEHPLGYGQINHSFGALAIQKWSDFHKPDGNNRGATHSGWLDFALGFGLPGLLLVWLPLFVSYARARKHSDFWRTYVTWAIPVIAIGYLITELCTGHFIELLFFMTALFSGLTLQTTREPNRVIAD
jgi:hypothetical protein